VSVEVWPSARAWTFGAETEVQTGQIEGQRLALLRFDLGGLPPSAQVTSATLALFTGACCTADSVEVHKATAPWSESTVTYTSLNGAFEAGALAAARHLGLDHLAGGRARAPRGPGPGLVLRTVDPDARLRPAPTGQQGHQPPDQSEHQPDGQQGQQQHDGRGDEHETGEELQHGGAGGLETRA